MADHGFIHLSAGDLLRAEIASGSEHGEMIDKIIKDGQIVPVAITCGLIKAAMEKAGWGGQKFLVDGFPRNQDNKTGWEEVMGDSIQLAGVLHFMVTEEVLEQRIIARAEEQERAGGERRTDDNIETRRRRFAQYKNEQLGIIAMYAEQGLVHELDGSQPIDTVYNNVKTALAGHI